MSEPSWEDVNKGDIAELPFDHPRAAMARIGQTDDGKIMINWMLRAMAMRPAPEGCADSALRDVAARQRIAHRLIRLLEGS